VFFEQEKTWDAHTVAIRDQVPRSKGGLVNTCEEQVHRTYIDAPVSQ
jgi:hypothetical protein